MATYQLLAALGNYFEKLLLLLALADFDGLIHHVVRNGIFR